MSNGFNEQENDLDRVVFSSGLPLGSLHLWFRSGKSLHLFVKLVADKSYQ